jgi:hypothetical protein
VGRRSQATRRRVLDAGALVALERGDPRIRATAEDETRSYVIPAPVLAQVWRDGARQARLARLLHEETTTIDQLDEGSAKAVGILLGRSGTSDIVDASVVLSARRHNAVVLTGNAADLLRIDPGLPVVEI